MDTLKISNIDKASLQLNHSPLNYFLPETCYKQSELFLHLRPLIKKVLPDRGH